MLAMFHAATKFAMRELLQSVDGKASAEIARSTVINPKLATSNGIDLVSKYMMYPDGCPQQSDNIWQMGK